MFIESSIPIDLGSPFMGERRLVALLKELLSLIGVCVFYKYFTATRFFPTDSEGATAITD